MHGNAISGAFEFEIVSKQQDQLIESKIQRKEEKNIENK